MRFQQRARLRGFTLFEVMLALGIFMLAGVSLTVALNQVLDAAIAARKSDEVRQKIKTYLAESRLPRLTPGEEKLSTELDGTIYERQIELLQFKNIKGQELPGIYRIRITASNHKAHSEKSGEVYVYQP